MMYHLTGILSRLRRTRTGLKSTLRNPKSSNVSQYKHFTSLERDRKLTRSNVDWKGVHNKHDLAKQTRFGAEFISGEWSDATSTYSLNFKETNGGEMFEVVCDVLVSAMGGLSTPLLNPPGMKGIESFKGDVFHSAQWNNMSLKNKRVGVIGNGCSASQFVPILAEEKVR